jgi:hypothetical protein
VYQQPLFRKAMTVPFAVARPLFRDRDKPGSHIKRVNGICGNAARTGLGQAFGY